MPNLAPQINHQKFMKKLYGIIVALILLPIGCEREVVPTPEPEDVTINISTELVSFSSSGGTQEVEVIVTGGDWSASSDKPWCVVSKGSGLVTIQAEVNSNEEPMEDAKVTITSGSVKKTILVKQMGTKNGNTSYTLSSSTKIITRDLLQKITNGELEGELIFSSQIPENEIPRIGEILLIDTPTSVAPSGFIGKITGVNANIDGSRTISTERVPFPEAFSKLNIDTTGLDLAGYVSEILDGSGRPVTFRKTKAISPDGISQQSISLTLPSDLIEFGSDNISFSPSIDIKLGMRIQTVVQDKQLLMFNMLVDPDISIGADFTISTSNKVEYERLLLSVYMTPIPVGPMIVTPHIKFSALVRIDGTVELTSNLTYDHSLTVGVKYETGDWNAIYRDRSEEGGDDPIKYGSKIRLNGGVGVGVKTRVGFGLYGELMSGDLAISTLLRGSGEATLDLAYPDEWVNKYLQLSRMTLQSDFLIDADASVSILGNTIAEEEIPGDITFPLDTLYLLPELQEGIKSEINGRTADMELEFKHRSVLMGKIIGQVRGVYSGTKLPDIEFKPEGGAYDPANHNQKKKFTSRLSNLTEGETYTVELFIELSGVKISLNQELVLKIEDSKVINAARAILSDLYHSAGGASWSGCNWFDQGVKIENFEGVSIYTAPGKTAMMSINLRDEWRLTGDMVIGNHTANLDLLWSIFGKNNCKTIVVQDLNCEYIDVTENTNLERLEIHSPQYSFYMNRSHTNLKYLDVSGTGTTEIAPVDFISGSGLQPVSVKLTELIVDNCAKLKKIHLDGGNNFKINTSLKLNLSALNTPKLEQLNLDSLNLNFMSGLDAKAIELKNCNLTGVTQLSSSYLNRVDIDFNGGGSIEKLSIIDSPNLEYININYSSMELSEKEVINELEVANCDNLAELRINNTETPLSSLLGILTVTNCRSLDWLDAQNLKLREITLSSLPALTHLFVKNNLMTGVMLPIFDEVMNKSNNSWANYDIRYSYYDTGTKIEVTDHGVGYWYSGEPDRGYHRR